MGRTPPEPISDVELDTLLSAVTAPAPDPALRSRILADGVSELSSRVCSAPVRRRVRITRPLPILAAFASIAFGFAFGLWLDPTTTQGAAVSETEVWADIGPSADWYEADLFEAES